MSPADRAAATREVYFSMPSESRGQFLADAGLTLRDLYSGTSPAEQAAAAREVFLSLPSESRAQFLAEAGSDLFAGMSPAERAAATKEIHFSLPSESRAQFLAASGVALADIFSTFSCPPFQLEGWAAHGEYWSRANNRRKTFTLAKVHSETGRTHLWSGMWLDYARDLSPRTMGWTAEVAFRPYSLRDPSHANPVFSQFGMDQSSGAHAVGWEIRASKSSVEVLFVTQRSELAQLSPRGLRRSGASTLSGGAEGAVRLGQWVHVFVTAARETLHGVAQRAWELTLYVNGDLAATSRAEGDFCPAAHVRPALGRSPEWADRFLDGDVAFANVQHEVPDDAAAYACALAAVRMGALTASGFNSSQRPTSGLSSTRGLGSTQGGPNSSQRFGASVGSAGYPPPPPPPQQRRATP